MRKTILLLGMLSVGYAYAQEHDGKVGINTRTPKATLEIVLSPENIGESTNEGLLIPKISKERIANIDDGKLVDGTLVYVDGTAYTGTNSKVSEITQKGFYYYDETAQKWVKTANGAVGPQGPKGASVLTGNAVPQPGTGTSGDSYINTSNGDFYTKNGSAWSKVGSIRGANGTNGTPGATGPRGASVLTGNTVPQPNTGTSGDSYINTSNGDFYTKNGAAWSKVGNIRGPQGAAGTSGNYVNSTSIAVSGNQLHRAALTGDVTAAANNNTVTINNNAINSAKIQDGTVTNADLANNAVTGPKILNGTITADKLAADAIKNIYNTDGTLTANRTVNTNGHNLSFTGTGKVRIGNSLDTSTAEVAIEGTTEILGNKPLSLVGGDRLEIELFNDYTKNTRARMGFLPPFRDHLMISHPDGHILLDTNGFVGIGTTNPEANLDVNGNARITNLANAAGNRNVIAKQDGTLALGGGGQRYIDLISGFGVELDDEPKLKAEDNGGIVFVESIDSAPVQIPDDLGDNFSCVVIQLGPAQVEMTSPSGKPIFSARGTKTRTQYSAIGVVVRKHQTTNSNEIFITGDAVY